MTQGHLASLAEPKGWRFVRFDVAFRRRRMKGVGHLEPLSVFLEAGVVPRAAREDNHNRLGADLDSYLKVEPGDLVFNKLRTWQGGFGHSRYFGIVSPAYFVCVPVASDSRFINYLLHSSPYLQELTRISKFMPPSQFDIEWEQLRILPLLVPPDPTQRAIADFLDKKTAAIDSLIAKKERLIELLQEKRQALTTQAVTKGLDPNVPMKDSGVEWLGEIPIGWEVVPLRYLLREGPKNGISPPPATAEGVMSFSTAAVREGVVTIDGNEKYVELPIDVARKYMVRAGDIFALRGSGNVGLVGTCGLLREAPPQCTYPDILIRLRAGTRVQSEFLVAAVNSPYVRAQIEMKAQTSNGIYKISGEDVRCLQLALPPLHEQDTLLEQLAKTLAPVAAAIASLRASAQTLSEYRQALITEAVTGKLDIPAEPS